MSGRGKLIVIEGLDGSGKATQTSLLSERLAEVGAAFRHVSFPDYKEPSSALVKMYLHAEFGEAPEDVNAYAASSFYAVDRYASFKKHWEGDYLAGKLILADRYATSNAIYQMVKLPAAEWDNYLSWLEEYEYRKLLLPPPDLVLYLDMPPELSQKLLSGRYGGDESQKDLHEKNTAFLMRCRKAAVYSAERLRWKVIDCAQGDAPRPVGDIAEEIWRTVREVIG